MDKKKGLTTMLRIPVSAPIIAKNARKYLSECLQSGWIGGAGPFLERFELDFAKFVGVKHAISCSNGTAALHLALVSLDIDPTDEVIMPALTMISTIMPVIYTGATPVLADVEMDTGNIDLLSVQRKINKKTKAIIPVHLNGNPADMENLIKLAKKNKLAIIEDAAEAHGALCKIEGKWKKVGSIGSLGCFSFYANKIVAIGEGGIITTNSNTLVKKLKRMRDLDRNSNRHFLHRQFGFNYRLSGLQAALGIAQLEEVEKILQRKKQIYSLYSKLLKNIPFISFLTVKDYAKSAYWNCGILIKENSPKNRDQLAEILKKNGIETRTFYIPLHKQPVLKKRGFFKGEKYPDAEYLAANGLNLPTGPKITNSQIRQVCQVIKNNLV